jgi:FMN reductase
MKIATILGSFNKNGSCAHALNIVQDELRKSNNIELISVDPNDFVLPFPGQSLPNSDEKKLQLLLSDAGGIIIATPEYHGSISSIVKLIIENLGFPSVLSICSHVGSIVLPGPVSIPNVHSAFDKEGNCLDVKVEKRLRTFANEMIKYAEKHICPAHALEEQVRENL